MGKRRRNTGGDGLLLLVLVAVYALAKHRQLALGILVVLAVIYAASRLLRPRSREDVYPERAWSQDVTEPLPSADDTYGWAYTPKKYFFTRSEAAFFHGVRSEVPANHHIFPKVRLSDLVEINATGREHMSAFGRVSQKHVDFVLCDSTFRPYLVIEVDGWSHQRSKQQKADETKDRVLDVSGLPILRFAVGTNWDFGMISRYIPSGI